MLANQPASKRVNAWLAGAPAIVAPEPAFMALPRGPLDFMATGDAPSTVRAIARLARDPGLRRAMVENGRRRAAEFDVEAVRRQWLTLLEEVVVPHYERWRRWPGGALMRYLPFLLRMSAQKIETKRSRARKRRDRRATRP